MEELAGAVRAILQEEKIDKILLVGHSMGGYVTMAFADLYPESLLGYVLFHSTCFADSEEKKRNRQREISLVLCGKKCQIINVNIPKGFANDNVERLRNEVERVRDIALDNPEEGIVAMLNGMMQRPDRTSVLQDSSLPLLLIGGMKDNYIPAEVFERLVGLAPHARVLRLNGSGHMGFIEEPELAAGAIFRMLDDGGE
jgi:pimeloyl-ACP methyl ester carboxylesterase